MEFKDRVANKPNRVKLTYEDGGASVYATVDLADEPIEEGTPLNAINMNKLLNKEDNDYIVEQGTSGIWTYRKWSSGVAECWGRTASKTISNWDPEYCGISGSLPITFISHPDFNCTSFQVGALKSYLTLSTATQNSFEAYMWCSTPPTDAQPCWFNINVKGRWK